MLIILVHWLFYKITFLRSTDLRLLWFLRINYLSLLFAELIAIYHGIKLAWHKGIRNLNCESDSKVALELIMGVHIQLIHVLLSFKQ